MAPTHSNPNDITDGMVVRSIARPSKVYRVSGIPDRGRSTFVAMSSGTQTVMNGNARNYRPETPDERAERVGDEVESEVEIDSGDEGEVQAIADDEANSVDPDGFGIAELCVRMQDAVARVADGDCDSDDAAAIVSAAAALNEAVVQRQLAGYV
ncbi:hypothetical protein GCM10007304_37250 [Rhodococcoides trifolii]|uniref:Uncharacterized protein n=1 Tax=Rhodococcoides trifolii TaxID=908250 RepID=A0A917G2I9_9NOCA|nr:hypothetical protein [Rhodococcus trifolii]GGG19900.1 hypothetical protein GCM10007304_37250 [Rhodococcus trifolii]